MYPPGHIQKARKVCLSALRSNAHVNVMREFHLCVSTLIFLEKRKSPHDLVCESIRTTRPKNMFGVIILLEQQNMSIFCLEFAYWEKKAVWCRKKIDDCEVFIRVGNCPEPLMWVFISLAHYNIIDITHSQVQFEEDTFPIPHN